MTKPVAMAEPGETLDRWITHADPSPARRPPEPVRLPVGRDRSAAPTLLAELSAFAGTALDAMRAARNPSGDATA